MYMVAGWPGDVDVDTGSVDRLKQDTLRSRKEDKQALLSISCQAIASDVPSPTCLWSRGSRNSRQQQQQQQNTEI